MTSLALAGRAPGLPDRPRGSVAGLSLAAAGRMRARRSRRRAGLLLLPRDAGDRRRPRPLPPLRRAGRLGQGRRDAVSRALDVRRRGDALLSLASPVLGAAAIAIRIEDGGPVALPAAAGRPGGGREFELLKLRTMVVGAETIGRGVRRRPAAIRASPGRDACSGVSRSTSCRSSGTCCAARWLSSGRDRRSPTRSSSTRRGSAAGST